MRSYPLWNFRHDNYVKKQSLLVTTRIMIYLSLFMGTWAAEKLSLLKNCLHGQCYYVPDIKIWLLLLINVSLYSSCLKSPRQHLNLFHFNATASWYLWLIFQLFLSTNSHALYDIELIFWQHALAKLFKKETIIVQKSWRGHFWISFFIKVSYDIFDNIDSKYCYQNTLQRCP